MALPTFVLGGFNLSDISGVAYGTSVMASGTSKGSPVPLEVAVKSWLQDGSIVVTQGYDNRTVTVRVKLRAPTATALATAEAALFAELGKPNTLTWTPASGPAAVFVVVTSSMDPVEDETSDLAENRAAYPWRHYDLRLVCKAFVNSAAAVVATALPATGTTTTLVNNGSATTNWTGEVNGTPTSPSVVSGAVRVASSSVTGLVTVANIYTASITTSSTKYLVVDWKPESSAGSPDLRAYGDAVELARIAEATSPTAGFARTWFGPVAASSIAVLRLESTSTIPNLNGVGIPAIRSLSIDNINRTDVKPSLGTGRQLLRSIPVAGSARSPGDIAIEHASSSLGDVLAYFYPDSESVQGYSPPLRQYRVSGGTVTADSAMVSGSYEDIKASTVTYDVPWNRLAAGDHGLLVKLATTGIGVTGTLNWTSATRLNSTQLGSARSGSRILGNPTTQTIFAIARLDLPTVDVDVATSTAFQRITLAVTGTVGNAYLDEAWLFNRTIGQLVGPIACGSGTAASGGPARRLFIEAPTVLRPRPSLRIGHASDRSDAYYPVDAVGGWDFPGFTPERVNAYTVTTNAVDASVTLTNVPAWHTNPAA